MGLFEKKETENPVKTPEQLLKEKQTLCLEFLRDEINKHLVGKTYNFGLSPDREKYMSDTREYVERNSEYRVTEMTFGDDRILHIILEPKPSETIIEIIPEKKEDKDGE